MQIPEHERLCFRKTMPPESAWALAALLHGFTNKEEWNGHAPRTLLVVNVSGELKTQDECLVTTTLAKNDHRWDHVQTIEHGYLQIKPLIYPKVDFNLFDLGEQIPDDEADTPIILELKEPACKST